MEQTWFTRGDLGGVPRQWRMPAGAARRALAVLVAAPLVVAGLLPAAAQADSTGPTTVTFTYSGAAQTWTVPAGVTSATFDVLGAQGGNALYVDSGNCSCGGGLGGETTVTLPVTPGQTLQVNVGGAGGTIDLSVNQGSYHGTYGSGGFNGGGSGGKYPQNNAQDGGGGGGASDVRGGAFGLSDRLVVAGGGGGAGAYGTHGGAGGGSTGVAGEGHTGTMPNVDTATITGGGPGTQAAAGAAGVSNCLPPEPGTAGTSGQGGGGVGASFSGGGGGGGYNGGGGGGSCTVATGGGGGSGYSSGPGAVFQTGVRSGNGQVTITYTVTTPRTVVAYNPTGSQCSCNAVPAAAVASGFTASTLSQVGMLGGWGNTDVWPVGQIGPSSSINPGQYLTFSVTPNLPTRFTSLALTEQSYVGQGPRTAAVRSSLDGFATDIATVTGLNSAGVNQIAFDLATMPIAAGQVELRVYFFNTPASGQDWADLVSTNRAGATGLLLTGDLP